jgi:branched-chain amino acid aminotransferase
MQPGFKIPKIKSENPEISENPVQVYEVIRIIDGIPLFLEDHLERLKYSADLAGIKDLPCRDTLEQKLFELITDKKRQFGNIKLTIKISGHLNPPQCELDFIPHFYPTDDKYSTGVKIGLMEAERPNPQAKLQHQAIRNKANLLMSKENVFEVLLVDHQGNITEGSRSNVFFIKNDQLFTAPDETVLNGITRGKILTLCGTNNISITQKDIPAINLKQFQGAFLTGSSPKVLPVSAIGEIRFDPSLPLIKKLINLYDQSISVYLSSRKANAEEANG